MAQMNLEPMRRRVSPVSLMARGDYLNGYCDRRAWRNSPSYRNAWQQEFEDLATSH